MDKIKQEFLSAIIFVSKWLIIGLGGVGILYFTISLAYHKLYYDPRMDAFDLEITELIESKNRLEITKSGLNDKIDSINKRLEIQKDKLSESEKAIEEGEKEIEDLKAKCLIIKFNPFPEKNKNKEDVCKKLKKVEKERLLIIEEQEKLEEESNELKTSVKNITKKINKHNSDIKKVETKKRKAEVGEKSLFFWLFGFLCLT